MKEADFRRAVALACDLHGPKVVSDAAYAAMSGRREPLAAVGLEDAAGNLPALNLATVIAFKVMDGDDRAADLAEASIALAKLPRQGKGILE